MSIGAVGSQNQVRLYRHNQADAAPVSPDNTKRGAASETERARIDISRKARELQAQKDADAAKQAADKRAEETRPAASSQRQRVNLVV